MKSNKTKAVVIFLVVSISFTVLACDTGGNGIEVPEPYDGPVWTVVEDSPFGDQNINTIAYWENRFSINNPSVFVAGGDGGKLAWSVNGQDWTAVDDGPFGGSQSDIYSIVYGSGILLAGGSADKIGWSNTGGKNWTSTINNPFDGYISVIAYEDLDEKRIFVAGSDKGEIAWSQNLTLWTAAENNTFESKSVNAIAFGVLRGTLTDHETGRFIAVGNNGKMAISQVDAASWSAVSNPPFGSDNINGIAYGSGKFVSVSYYGGIAWSQSGQSWTKVENSDEYGLRTVIYGDGLFVAAGDGNIVISSDGVTWKTVPDEYGGSFSGNAIAYSYGTFVVVGNYGKIAYSD
jgi:hypothetical protein